VAEQPAGGAYGETGQSGAAKVRKRLAIKGCDCGSMQHAGRIEGCDHLCRVQIAHPASFAEVTTLALPMWRARARTGSTDPVFLPRSHDDPIRRLARFHGSCSLSCPDRIRRPPYPTLARSAHQLIDKPEEPGRVSLGPGVAPARHQHQSGAVDLRQRACVAVGGERVVLGVDDCHGSLHLRQDVFEVQGDG
jgi:hypothetical protein